MNLCVRNTKIRKNKTHAKTKMKKKVKNKQAYTNIV